MINNFQKLVLKPTAKEGEYSLKTVVSCIWWPLGPDPDGNIAIDSADVPLPPELGEKYGDWSMVAEECYVASLYTLSLNSARLRDDVTFEETDHPMMEGQKMISVKVPEDPFPIIREIKYEGGLITKLAGLQKKKPSKSRKKKS